MTLNTSTKGKEKSKQLLLSSPIHSDAEAIRVSNLLKWLGLTSEANSVLTQRGLVWLQRSLRLSSDSVTQLYRKGGMETKALSFFINGLDSRRARALIDCSLRRCLVSITQTSPHLSLHFHLKYQSVDEILPPFPESLQESPVESLLLHSRVISDPAVEVSISSGLICAIDETIGVTLCGSEGVTLRYYVEACQYLLSLFQSFNASDSQSYEQILVQLRLLANTAIPLRYLIGPSQAATVTHSLSPSSPAPPPPAISCLLSCPQRYWLHLIDLILLVDKIYNLKYESLEEILAQGSYSPSEYDSLLSQYNSLVIILFNKKEIETLLQMLHHSHCLYLQQGSHHNIAFPTTRRVTAALDLDGVMTGLFPPLLLRPLHSLTLSLSLMAAVEFHPLLLAMYQSSIYVFNYEQYDSSQSRSSAANPTLGNRNTFTLFHLRNLRSSLNMNPSTLPPSSSAGEGREERKTTVLKLTVPAEGPNSRGSALRNHSTSNLQAKANQYLTVAPSSLSYRMMK
jgi:hypothetical protein